MSHERGFGMANQQRTPGPKYDVLCVTRHGAVKPAGTLIRSRQKERVVFTPGPAAYDVQHVTKNQPPMYTMGAKRTARMKPSPAPNAYQMAPTIGNGAPPDMSSAPVYSMPGRGGGRRNNVTLTTPGPAHYPAVDVTLTSKPRAPRPVMLGRRPLQQRRGQLCTPAPNAYSPGPAGLRYAKAPEVSMAGRSSYKARVYMTAADRAPDWE